MSLFTKKVLTPEVRAAKANKLVTAALTVFETAANELEKASEHHFDIEDALRKEADDLIAAAHAKRDEADTHGAQGFKVSDHADRIRSLATV